MMKRIIRKTSLIWAIALLLSLLPAFGVFAATTIDAGITFKVTGVAGNVVLLDSSETPVPVTALAPGLSNPTEVAAGSTQTLTVAALSVGTHEYYLKQTNSDTETVAYDYTKYKIKITVFEVSPGVLDYLYEANGGGWSGSGKATSITFTNSKKTTPSPDTVDVIVSKLWSGVGAGETLPSYITVHLLRDGVKIDTATLDAIGSWRHTFTGLPKGYTYDIEEDPVPGFKTSITKSDIRVTITNSKEGGTPPSALLDPPVKKTVINKNGEPYTGSDVFEFTMEALQPDAPMPGGVRGGTKTVSVIGSGMEEFGDMAFGPEDIDKNYSYRVKEKKGSNAWIDYDTSYYTMNVAVRVKDGVITLSVSHIKDDNSMVSLMEFTNYVDDPGIGGGDDPPPGGGGDPPPGGGEGGDDEDEHGDDDHYGNLPQTGQLWWPVPILAGSGSVFSVAGILLRRKEDEDDEE